MEILNILLNKKKKNDTFDKVFQGGEIIAGPDGEALLFDIVSFKDEDDYEGEVADPVVYKTPEEAMENHLLLKSIDNKIINNLNIKKLEKSFGVDGYFDDVTKEKLVSDLFETLNRFRTFYENASSKNMYCVLFNFIEQ
jgi:hypothetical protein